MRANHESNESVRVERLLEAQRKAVELFAAIDSEAILRPGMSDVAASDAVRDLAATRFGVARHWHKRIIRSGPNTLRPYQDDPPDRVMTDDDIVFADFGPVFAGWEADFGRTWVIGSDPAKLRLRDDLAEIFAAGSRLFESAAALTAADLYAEIVRLTEERGWKFGNYHSGHLVGEFPHENFDGEKVNSMITPANRAPLRRKDPSGRTARWILEVHLVDEERGFGGFYEELLL